MDRSEEAMSATAKVHIETTPGTCGGRPRIAGTRIRVQDVYVWHELQGESPDEIVARYPELSLADVHAALMFYFDHRDDIQRQMREDAEYVESLRKVLGPGPLEELIQQWPPHEVSPR
jgi:uncharacterized protein (DUF433 family)